MAATTATNPKARSGKRRTRALAFTTAYASNENKMSDGGRGRMSLVMKVCESSQNWIVQRSVVRSIAWLDANRCFEKSIFLMPNLLLILAIICKNEGHAAGELQSQIS